MKKLKGIKKIVCLTIAVVTVIAFSGVAFAYSYDSGSWKSGTCMTGFTCNDSLTKTTTNWDSFTPNPVYVEYANDNYVSDDESMNAYVKAPGGTKLSPTCNCHPSEDDDVAMYDYANDYDTLRVRIENSEHPNVYNMKSKGTFQGSYNNNN